MSEASSKQDGEEQGRQSNLRRLVLKRDDYECRTCSSLGGPRGDSELHAHHRVPQSEGGEDSMENLITLCSTCHRRLHGKPVIDESQQFSHNHVVSAIEEIDCPVVTTSDVSDFVGCTSETARVKLQDLHDWGAVEKRQVGARAVIWWISGENS